MDIFVVLYLLVIIVALVLILVLAKKKEWFSESPPFDMRCRNKAVEIRQIPPVFYFYFDNVACDPSKNFKDQILTQEITAQFETVSFIDLSQFDASLPDLFPYTDKISFTPSIIIEYPYVNKDTIKQKILDLQDTSKEIYVESLDETKYLIVIKNLDEYTPDDSDPLSVLQNKKNKFRDLIESMIITS